MRIGPLRTFAERARDDHEADLRMCGIQDDEPELEDPDLTSRHYDFAICRPSDGRVFMP